MRDGGMGRNQRHGQRGSTVGGLAGNARMKLLSYLYFPHGYIIMLASSIPGSNRDWRLAFVAGRSILGSMMACQYRVGATLKMYVAFVSGKRR